MEQQIVYLDNAATTPCDPQVVEIMTKALTGACGNPSSHYSVGYEAKEFVDNGRAQVAKAINADPSEIYFTGCGSEADNWAVKGTAFMKARQNKKHLITSAFEHHALLHSMKSLERMGFEVTYVPVTPEGFVRPEDVEAAIRPDTSLISIMMANNEIGTIQPIKEIAEIAHKHGVWMHTDAVQAVGAIPVDVKELGVDMLSMSAHKFNGPKGIGVLYCRKGVWPQNLIDGGSQEARHRAGTENVAGIAGMGLALEKAVATLDEKMAHEKQLRDYVIDRVLKNIPEARLNGSRDNRLPGNVNISFPGLEGETILLDLDMHGICASTGSACNSDSLDPSHVLLSIGVPEEIGHGSMRFTFGPQNTMQEAEYLCEVLEQVIPRRRAMSCMWLQGQNTARQFSLKGDK
jgi:cysteine desulfurase